MKEPARNWLSTRDEKVQYVKYLIKEARDTNNQELAWKLVDFLYDTMLIEELNDEPGVWNNWKSRT